MISKNILACAMVAGALSVLPCYAQVGGVASGSRSSSTFPVSDDTWSQWCGSGMTHPGRVCFHKTRGPSNDYSVETARGNDVILSARHNYFGAKCPTGTDPLVITVDGIGDITIKGPVKYQGKDCCSLIMTVIGKHYPKTVCPGDPAIEFPANL